MTQSLTQQIADIKERIEATKGTPDEATFQKVLLELEEKLQQTKMENNTDSNESETLSAQPTPIVKEISEENVSDLSNEEKKDSEKSESKNFFQAVGQLRGVIQAKEDQSGWYVKYGNYDHDLALSKKLQYVVHFVEGKELTLTVYPQVVYEKGKRDFCKIYFKLVGWTEERTKDEGLFTIKGIWQFIPQYKRPVISVYRNQKQWDGDRCKASHVPVLWKDSPHRPFKFNPKSKTQSDKYFAQVKTKFIPRLNTFGVVDMIAEPSLKVPRYIKPVKKEVSPTN